MRFPWSIGKKWIVSSEWRVCIHCCPENLLWTIGLRKKALRKLAREALKEKHRILKQGFAHSPKVALQLSYILSFGLVFLSRTRQFFSHNKTPFPFPFSEGEGGQRPDEASLDFLLHFFIKACPGFTPGKKVERKNSKGKNFSIVGNQLHYYSWNE